MRFIQTALIMMLLASPVLVHASTLHRGEWKATERTAQGVQETYTYCDRGVTGRQYGATDVRRNGAISKCLKWGLERCQEWVFLAPFAMMFLEGSGSGLGARKLSPSRISR